MLQLVTQPGFGIDTVQLGGADQRVDRGAASTAAVGASVQLFCRLASGKQSLMS